MEQTEDRKPVARAEVADPGAIGRAAELVAGLVENVQLVLVGKADQIQLGVICLLAGGHALIEDVPGVGKTTLAKALARSIGGQFERIQFTPDLLPSDVLGVNVFDPAAGGFHFRPGPVFANVLLADEINRATPKTQSALLEGMEERQVTLDGVTHPVPSPFIVLATQNPVEFSGTFPLPEAQLDRFSARVSLGYLTPQAEVEMLGRFDRENPLDELLAVTGEDDIRAAQAAISTVFVSRDVKQYVVALVGASRSHPDLSLGASPRASLALVRLGQALAAGDGRDYVLPDDIKILVEPVLAHRLVFKPSAEMRGTDRGQLLARLIDSVAVPQGGRGPS
ncbi:MAG: MoxR family ATPase [Candidatus Dormibacteraeota bacterium]|nr:MoxR family ATPase [Candidatus Dormibacteraeota bacterium]